MMRSRILTLQAFALPENLIAWKSGIITIPNNTIDITIQTNLGYIPDIAGLWVYNPDYSLLPLGVCVETYYNRNIYINTPNSLTTQEYHLWYGYKHGTSGNLLFGHSAGSGVNASANSFTFRRGAVDWSAVDVNSNSIKYEWFAVKLKEYGG